MKTRWIAIGLGLVVVAVIVADLTSPHAVTTIDYRNSSDIEISVDGLSDFRSDSSWSPLKPKGKGSLRYSFRTSLPRKTTLTWRRLKADGTPADAQTFEIDFSDIEFHRGDNTLFLEFMPSESWKATFRKNDD